MAAPIIASRRPGLIEAEVDGEIVALHVDNGTCYGFNATATRIWQLLETPQSLDALCAALTAEFDVEAGACADEVKALLDELAADGLIDLDPAAAA